MTSARTGFPIAVALFLLCFKTAWAGSAVNMDRLAVTDLAISAASVSWVTDQKTSSNWVSVRKSGTDSVVGYQDSYKLLTYVHRVDLTDLNPGTDYEYRLGSDSQAWDNNGVWYKFKTLSQSGSISLPKSMYCRVFDKGGTPLKRVLVRIRLRQTGQTSSLARTLLTDNNGYWSTDYTRFLAADGSLYDASGGERVLVEYYPNYWSSASDSSSTLSSESPQFLGQVSLEIFDPMLGSRGDLNEDGKINIYDLLDFLTILGRKYTPPLDPQKAFAADVDTNGVINIFDLIYLLRLMRN